LTSPTGLNQKDSSGATKATPKVATQRGRPRFSSPSRSLKSSPGTRPTGRPRLKSPTGSHGTPQGIRFVCLTAYRYYQCINSTY
jgi:hypothetical protein